MSKYDYQYIRAWGQMMQSSEYYIDDQVALARKENAPIDATWRGLNGKWHRLSDMLERNPNKKLIAAYAKGNDDETV